MTALLAEILGRGDASEGDLGAGIGHMMRRQLAIADGVLPETLVQRIDRRRIERRAGRARGQVLEPHGAAGVFAAEACHKAGASFGIGLGTTSDSVDTAGALFHSFGAQLVNAKGDIVVKNDQVRQVLDYYLLGKVPRAPADLSNRDEAPAAAPRALVPTLHMTTGLPRSCARARAARSRRPSRQPSM